jgi:hypothetical protein
LTLRILFAIGRRSQQNQTFNQAISSATALATSGLSPVIITKPTPSFSAILTELRGARLERIGKIFIPENDSSGHDTDRNINFI